MPSLDAKALETDQEGLAFLRSVLRPESGGAGSAHEPAAARARPGLAFELRFPADESAPSRPREPESMAPAA